jgi:hypothetical protein
MKSQDRPKWILLIHQLPTKPTNLRVRIWRKLQTLGAVPIKNSVYVLPLDEKTNEDFQWLKQEIESSGGEAAVFHAVSVEGTTDKELAALFCRQRDEEYAKLITEFESLSGAIREQKKTSPLSANKLGQFESDLNKLGQELERIAANDFFQAALGTTARTAFENCRKDLKSAKGTIEKADRLQNQFTKLNIGDYQNRRWITRKNPHIDRLASGWLIKRFIDGRPRFSFAAEDARIEKALTFDMVGGNFTHQGEDCTFETLIKSFALDNDSALRQIAEIVHDIDLKDQKYNRSEASGVNSVVRGLAEVYADDNERLKQSLPIFDGLYELFKVNAEQKDIENTDFEIKEEKK